MASLGLGWLAQPVFMAVLSPVLGGIGVVSLHFQRISGVSPLDFPWRRFSRSCWGNWGRNGLPFRSSLPTALWVATPLHWFYRISYPFNWILESVRTMAVAPGGHRTVRLGALRSFRGGIASDVEPAAASGGSSLGHAIVLNALDLNRHLVRNVMRPRQEISRSTRDASIRDCIEIAEKTRYSRFPLCQGGELDKSIGVVHIKDLYASASKMARARGPGASGAEIDLCAGNGAAGKIAATFPGRGNCISPSWSMNTAARWEW